MSALNAVQRRHALDLPVAERSRVARILEDLLASAARIGYTCEIQIGASATQFDWRQPAANEDGGLEPVGGPLRARLGALPAPTRRLG